MSELGLDTRDNLINALKLVKNDRYTSFAKVLNERRPFFQDLLIQSANGILSDEESRVTSIPTPQIINVGDGHDASVVRWDTFKENISIFKDRWRCPLDVADLQPDFAAYRADQEDQHSEGFMQGVTNHFFYGTSVATPTKFDGLDVRYKTPDNGDSTYDALNPDPTTAADFGVFDAAGTGSQTMSIWLVQHSKEKFCGISPINDPQMGLRVTDSGLVYADAENSKERQEYRTEFSYKVGLKIKDIRSVARIRNIDSRISQIDPSVLQLIYQARNEVFKGNEPVFMYIPKRMLTFFQIMAESKQNVLYDKNNIYEVLMYRFGDMMIRAEDALSITETAVTAV